MVTNNHARAKPHRQDGISIERQPPIPYRTKSDIVLLTKRIAELMRLRIDVEDIERRDPIEKTKIEQSSAAIVCSARAKQCRYDFIVNPEQAETRNDVTYQ
jgi:hypothetical protein